LQTLPADIRGHALIEVPDVADILELATPAHVEVRWCGRDDRPRGERLTALVRQVLDRSGALGAAGASAADILEAVDVDAEILWETPESAPDRWYAWLAGEAAMV